MVKSVADLYKLNEEMLASLKQEVERNGVKKMQRVFGPVEIRKLLKQIEKLETGRAGAGADGAEDSLCG